MLNGTDQVSVLDQLGENALAGHTDQWLGFPSLRQHRDTYLWVLQTSEVWVQVELDARRSTRQCHTTNQQHDEHDKWERSCDVDHLRESTEKQGHTMETLRLVSFHRGVWSTSSYI